MKGKPRHSVPKAIAPHNRHFGNKKKYRIIICDDSERERQRFYSRQFDNFDIPGVTRKGDRFTETDPLDSVDKLYQRVIRWKRDRNLPDLILLDLFYKKPIPGIDAIERQFVNDLLAFKEKFLRLKRKALDYLEPTGITVLQRIREVDRISSAELPIAVYTDKNFNFLPSDQFNLLYRLDAGTVHKDRDEDPGTQISAPSEYLKLLHMIESRQGTSSRALTKVFISHGPSPDWLEVQSFLEQEANRVTFELAQSPSRGATVIKKLADAANQCSHAVIVMTGDDAVKRGALRVRENVMHEIGYFQGRLGLNRVVLLREEGVSMPSNLGGIVYLSFRRGRVRDVFPNLQNELV